MRETKRVLLFDLQLFFYSLASSSTSFQRRHSQPIKASAKDPADESMTKTLSHHQYDSNNSLNSNNSR